VLESIKLFFDMPGFIFVVGLDEHIVERAIRAKFAVQDEQRTTIESDHSEFSITLSQRLSREYIKKIFQISYSLPQMLPQQLEELLHSMYSEAALSPTQLDDLQRRVRPYLNYIAVGRRVNPREVKRFINSYTLQVLVRPSLDPETVLALQTLAFRDEWELLYDALLADPDLFVDILRRYRSDEDEDDAFRDLSPRLLLLPPSLIAYLRSSLATPLVNHASLDPYISILQSADSTKSWVLDIYRQIGTLRKQVKEALALRPPRKEQIDLISEYAIRMVSDTFSMLSQSGPSGTTGRLESTLRKIRDIAATSASMADRSSLNDGTALIVPLTELGRLIQVAQDELKIIRDFMSI
jgi:hypothetical protein